MLLAVLAPFLGIRAGLPGLHRGAELGDGVRGRAVRRRRRRRARRACSRAPGSCFPPASRSRWRCASATCCARRALGRRRSTSRSASSCSTSWSASACRTAIGRPARRRRRVVDGHEVEPVGRRDRAGAAAVAGGERLGDRRRPAICPRRPSSACPTIERTWLCRNERALARTTTSSPSRDDVEAVERLHRRLRLALGGAEGGEVVLADERLRRRVHGRRRRAAPPTRQTRPRVEGRAARGGR